MKRRTIGESRSSRIEKRLTLISELYDMAFVLSEVDEEIKQVKRNLNFVNDEQALVECCKQIAEQIAILETPAGRPATKNDLKVASWLRDVFNQIKSLIFDEFRTIRNRNNRLPRIDVW